MREELRLVRGNTKSMWIAKKVGQAMHLLNSLHFRNNQNTKTMVRMVRTPRRPHDTCERDLLLTAYPYTCYNKISAVEYRVLADSSSGWEERSAEDRCNRGYSPAFVTVVSQTTVSSAVMIGGFGCCGIVNESRVFRISAHFSHEYSRRGRGTATTSHDRFLFSRVKNQRLSDEIDLWRGIRGVADASA